MRESLEEAGLGFLVVAFYVIVIVAVLVGGSFLSFKLYAYYNPKYTAVQYQTFKQSQQYNEGQIQTLEQYRESYATATAIQKKSICSIVNEQYAAYDRSKLTPEQASFVADCANSL